MIFILLFSIASVFANPQLISQSPYTQFIENERFKISKSEIIIAEKVTVLLKLIEKGYVSEDVFAKSIKETKDSKHFSFFRKWLISIQETSKLKTSESLIAHCNQFIDQKEILPLEKYLERVIGNYCRERTLEVLGRMLDKNQALSPEANAFIQENLKYFLTKKNKKSFAFFLQSQANRPEILKKISQEITTYSVSHDIVPDQAVLKDIEMSEDITRLIQNKGFNPIRHQNVFYTEYGKLIEQSYKSLDSSPTDNKLKEHFNFMRNYIDLNYDHLPVSLCLSRLNDLAKSVFRNGLKELSQDMFSYILKMNDKEVHEDALFFYMWTHLYFNEFDAALKIAKKYDLLKSKAVIVDPRLRFWIGLSLEKIDEKDAAIENYEKVIKDSPLSFYAIMAAKKMLELKPDSPSVLFYKNSAQKNNNAIGFEPLDVDEDFSSSLIRLKAWAAIDNARMMKIELKRILNHSMPNFLVKFPTDKQIILKSDLHLLIAKIIQESKNYLATFRYLYEALDKKEVLFGRSLLEILYPNPFLEDLKRTLKDNSIDPIIVLSLIRQESVFNPHARSPVGARGLMQLMPSTARRLKRSIREKQLVNPILNIELGTKYFKNLLKRYDGNLVYVLAAYNAGENRVERWKGLYFDSDESILKNIESIPFLETRNYVKLIFRNIFFYKLLSENNLPAQDTLEHNKIFDVSLGFKR